MFFPNPLKTTKAIGIVARKNKAIYPFLSN